MKIEIETIEGNYGPSYNVSLIGKTGEAFLAIKGVRVVDGQKGRFLSMPSKKLDSGKYWNHVWASDTFQSVVLAQIEAQPKAAPKPAPKPAAAAAGSGFDDMENDVPF